MCGIAGYFAYRSAARAPDIQELVNVDAALKQRGPDDAGLWQSPDRRTALSHRRLAIIDLSAAAAQPMASDSGRYRISFNGEIYNFQALRKWLEDRGVRFRSKSDTEVLLQLYIHQGSGMLPRLQGMYAFAIWDDVERKLFVARDPYGIKPLYFCDEGGVFRFASQVRALLAGKGVSATRDPAGLVGFMLSGSMPEPYTLYKSIRCLPAGCLIMVSEERVLGPLIHTSIASILAESPANPEFGELPISDALRDSVMRHLLSDVPVGVFLSAGIDSGTLLALGSEASAEPLSAITVGFDPFADSDADECSGAAEVARHYGARHTIHRVSESEFRKDLPTMLDAMDQPTIDGINTWFAAKATHQAGLKVAISGLGGDELFGGYPSFRTPPWIIAMLSCVQPVAPPPSRLLRALWNRATKLLPRLGPKHLGLLQYGGSYEGAYFLHRGLFMPWELPDILGDEAAEAGLREFDPMPHFRGLLRPMPGSPHGRFMTLESCLYMRNQLLRDSDWTGMAHSVEVRTPFADVPLLKAMAGLLATGTLPNKKLLSQMPRRALPPRVVRLPKRGFLTPVSQWMEGLPIDNWQSIKLLRDPRCHWSRRWAYSVLHSGVFA